MDDLTARHLLVVGATPAVRHLVENSLETPDGVTFVDDPEGALEPLAQHPDAVVAYGPNVFGLATTGQPARLGDATTSVAVLTDLPESGTATDNPETLIFQAAHALDVDYVVALTHGAARLTLTALLEGRVGR